MDRALRTVMDLAIGPVLAVQAVRPQLGQGVVVSEGSPLHGDANGS